MENRPKLGLKLWSINKNYLEPARKLYDEGVYSYIELYAIPDSFNETVAWWQTLSIPFVIHAPHFMQGLNFSDPQKENYNITLAAEALSFADKLNAESVIFHPGIKGHHTETARQMKKLNDGRVLVENKPYKVAKAVHGLTKDDVCVGHSPEAIEYIMNEAKVGFCLDIGHAFCAANSLVTNRYAFIEKFIALRPKMFHLSDGDAGGAIDRHDHFGDGSYELEKIIDMIGSTCPITIETEKDSKTDLEDFRRDADYLMKLMKQKRQQ